MDASTQPLPTSSSGGANDALIGTVVDGRYRILSRLARGGMATVYEALDTRLDRTVALKVMNPALAEDPDFVSRFRREARATAQLTHPHVVAVYDQGETDGIPYLAMEYVPGQTLRDVLREHGPLTPEQALTVLDPVLEALGAARAAPLVGRAVASVSFGVVHLANPGAGVRTTGIVMLAGWCLSLLREHQGLPAAWAAHLAWNWTMAAVLHVAVSGLPFATPGYRGVLHGPDWLSGCGWGPEGGLVAALVLGGVALWSARESLRSSTSGGARLA